MGCRRLHGAGVTGFTTSKMELEFAFAHAWRNFPLATTTFRGVHADLHRNDLLRILAFSPRRHWAMVAWQAERQWWTPHLHSDWTADDLAEHLDSLYNIPAETWQDLATSLIDRLGEQYVRRS